MYIHPLVLHVQNYTNPLVIHAHTCTCIFTHNNEISKENNVERTRAEEQSSHSPKQIRCLVEMKLRSKEPMHRFLGWNISNGTLQTNCKLETQVLQAKEETR